MPKCPCRICVKLRERKPPPPKPYDNAAAWRATWALFEANGIPYPGPR